MRGVGIVVGIVLLGAPVGAAPLRVTGETMGTTWAVSLARPPASVGAEGLRRAVEATLARVDRAASTWREDSELARFNAAGTTAWRPVSPMLARIVTGALRTSRLSGGAFDPTVAPLVDLWGFGPGGGPRARPTDDALRAARARVGFAHLAVRGEPPALRKDLPALEVDLSAIAKGFAVDRVAARLAEMGAHDVLVEIGGELRARGRNPDGEPWIVAVQRPNGSAGAASALLGLTDAAVATSGDYRTHFEQDGRRYSHLIDPRTGEPVSHGLASVTVVARSAMRADALATALLVLGPERGPALAERERLAALFLVREGDGFRATTTPALRPYERR